MISLPDALKEPMRLYREAEAPLPNEFTLWHRKLAEVDLLRRCPDRLDEYTIARHQISDTRPWIVLSDHGLVPDGFGADGFKVKQVVVAVNHGQAASKHGWGSEDWRVHTLRWHESGAWFEHGAGWTRFVEILPGVERDVLMGLPLDWTEENILQSMLARA